MVTLTRPEGNWAGDLDLTRRSIALALAGGYAVAAFSAEAEPIHTDETGLVTATVEIAAADRAIPGYLARPATEGRSPVVFVYSEIFGVHEWVKDICRRLAKAGYVALAPDFFVRAGDPSTLTDFPAIMKIVGQASDAQVTSDTAAALKFLKAQPWADTGRMGVTGFCWGGGKTWLAVERFAEFRAGVAWYGPLKPNPYPQTPPIELAADLHAPVLGLYGGKDRGIPAEDIEAMRAALKAAGKTDSEIVVYPDAQHGFLADYRQSYDPAAAADGWATMLAFFKAHGVE
ncbi:MAG: dienelactone hydrolase family protein [Phenylobacterium sp.]|uniref:dienelactone hydrolase family protein n=1 Tax=Phenylobacterium sp. TaxID=1871053 RepID=UPI0025F337FD|nr:dienelactone hydrolase family protein [Phenylobacterium sp.]MBI1200499.1 dienelactone hydrolase family protein [Phenylobacterium sp.]